MTICIDVDGVLNNLMEVTLKIFNERYKKSYQIEDVKTYNMEDCFEPEDAKLLQKLFTESDIWNKVRPIKGSQDALQKLIRDGHQIYLVTDNHPNTYGEKVAWIKRFFPFIESSKIVCMKDKWMFRCDIMIEDNYQTLLAKPYYYRILVDHPWNQSAKDYVYDVHRCKSWGQIIDVINKLNVEE